MKATILHESQGRIRVRMEQPRMTLEQADLLEAYLNAQPGVVRTVVHDRTRCAIITYQGDRQRVISAISQFSYEAPAVTALAPQHSGRALNREYEEKLVCMVLRKGLSSLFLPIPFRKFMACKRSLPFLRQGLQCLRHRRMGVELLDGISIGVSLVRRDFGTAGSVSFLLQLGELLEEWTHKKSVDDLARCMSLNVDQAWLVTPSGNVLTPLERIQVGDLVALHMGSVIPLDGMIHQGEVMVNQASLTGESIPVAKRPGTLVYAGTVVEEGECLLQVTQPAGQNRYDQIVAMIEQSELLKSAAEHRAANLADKLVPYTLAGSILTYALTRNVLRAVSVLMVDFSCALKLAMPLAVLSAMREASTHHITVKGGKYLEAVAQADTVVFDKTGTLTHACPQVVGVIPFGGNDPDEMLRVAACLEEHYPHSMANAVVRAAQEKGLAHEEMHSKVEYLVAHGIASSVAGQRVIIGSAHFVFEDEACIVPPGEEGTFEGLPDQYSHLYMAIGGVLAAVICVADPLRDEARDVIQALRALGIQRTVMLTGDSRRTAAAIAAQVGVDEFQAEVLPEDKAKFVEAQRNAGHTVIMLGDGINDSPALSAANVGIAISDGAAIAREIADITIAADSLHELVILRKLSQALMRRIDQNYRFVIGFNGGLIGLGAFGVLAPATSAALHNLSTLGVSVQSMTNLLEEKPREL